MSRRSNNGTAEALVVCACRNRGLGSRNTFGLGTLVRHRQQASDTASDSILRQRRIRAVAELVKACVAMLEAQRTGLAEVIWDVVTKDLESTLNTGTRGNSGLRGTAEVCIIKVDKAVDTRANFATLAQLVPLRSGTLGAHHLQDGTDGLTIADDNTWHTANFAGLRGNAEPVCCADEGHGSLTGRAPDFHGSRATRFGQRASSKEGSTPDGGKVSPRSCREAVGQTTDRATTLVKEPGLARKRFATLNNADGEVTTGATTGRLYVSNVWTNAVQLDEITDNSTCEDFCINLGFNGHAAGDVVESTSKAKNRRQLRRADRWSWVADRNQFALHVDSQ